MTFETIPENLSSVNSELIYVVYDANSINPTYTNYNYVCEVWVNGAIVQVMRVAPHPTNNRGIIDVADIVRLYIEPKLKFELGVNEFNIDCVVKVKEEYNGTIGGVVATSSNRTYLNNYNGRIDTFTIIGNYLNKFASNCPKTIYIPNGCNTFYLPRLSSTTTPFNVYIDGVPTTYTPTATNTIQHINIASANETIVLGSQQLNVQKVCYMNDAYVVHFLNKQGAFESFAFTKASKMSFDFTKKNYKQQPFKVGPTGVVSIKENDIMHRQVVNYGTTFKEKLRLTSDLLTNDYWRWLFELHASPIVYLQKIGEATLYPISITATTYDVKKVKIDGLQPLTIDVDFGTTLKTNS